MRGERCGGLPIAHPCSVELLNTIQSLHFLNPQALLSYDLQYSRAITLGFFYFHTPMRKLPLILSILSLAVACSSQQEQSTTTTSESSAETHDFTVPENTIYKVYPDGTKHLIQEKEFTDDGKLSIERQYISRVDDSDSSGYMYTLYKEFQYTYDSKGRLSEMITMRMSNYDTLLHEATDTYEWHGDTAIRSMAYFAYLTNGQEPNFQEKDRSVYDAQGRLTYKKTHNSFEPYFLEDGREIRLKRYLVEKYTYDGDVLRSIEYINRDNSNIERLGHVVLTNGIFKRIYTTEGKLLTDSMFRFEEYTLDIYEARVRVYNEYQEYVELHSCSGNPRKEEVQWNKGTMREIRHLYFPRYDYDPAFEVSVRKQEPLQSLDNWDYRREDILSSNYTYSEDGYIASRTDKFNSETDSKHRTSRVLSYIYNDQHQLIEQISVSQLRDGTTLNERIEMDRYDDGSLNILSLHEKDLLIEQSELSPSGAFERSYRAKRLNDSTIAGDLSVFDLSYDYNEAGTVRIVNGVYMKGSVVERDEQRRVVRFFDEESTNLDVECFYSADGDLVLMKHREVRHHFFPEGIRIQNEYEIHFGKGYSYNDLMISQFVPDVEVMRE